MNFRMIGYFMVLSYNNHCKINGFVRMRMARELQKIRVEDNLR